MTCKPCKNKPALLSTVLILAAAIIVSVLALSATVTAFAGNLLGDADNDGKVTIKDVTCIQRFLAELATGEISEAAADVDGNGEINISDATFIQMWLAEMETPYAIGVQPTEPTTVMPTDDEGWGLIIFRP